MLLYYLVKRFEKQTRENHLWNLTPKNIQTALSLGFYHSSKQTQNFLSLIWKSIPNIPEIVKNIEMLSIFKVVFSPVEQALGNDPNAFAFFREGVRIYTVTRYIKDGDEFGGSGIKYNYLHLMSSSISLLLKGIPLMQKWYEVGLSKGSLSKTSTPMIIASDVAARALAIAAESKNDITQKDLTSLEVVTTNIQASWPLIAIAGGMPRSYVSKVCGKIVESTGIYDKMTRLGNEIELSLFKVITGNDTISFSDEEHVISKANKCFSALENTSFNYLTCAGFSAVTILIEIESRSVAEILTIFPPMTITRMTAPIFENQMLNIIGNSKAVEVSNYGHIFEFVVLGSMGYDFFFVTSKNNNTAIHTEILTQSTIGNTTDVGGNEL